MRPVIIIGERQHLEMREEILADVVHHGLRRLRNDDTADGCEQHIDKDRDAQQD